MREIPLTQGRVALVDDEDFERASAFKWYFQRNGYAARDGRMPGEPSTVLLHRFILNAKSGMYVDHIDHDGLNCQRSNMRLCTHGQNMGNRRKSRGCASGFKGVTAAGVRWKAEIVVSRKRIYLGCFATEREAAAAYDDAAKREYGEFACLNLNGHAAAPDTPKPERKKAAATTTPAPIRPPRVRQILDMDAPLPLVEREVMAWVRGGDMLFGSGG